MAVALLRTYPLKILNDVCTKIGSLPKFELLQLEGEEHCQVYVYEVTVEGMTAVGNGSSKQKARNAAAQAILHEMMNDPERKSYIEANLEKIGQIKNTALTFDEQEEISGNPVGRLQELCTSRQWPPPHYKLMGENPSPNCLFTITCYVLEHTETGTGSSKKKAKRIAAKKMSDKLHQMLLSMPHFGPQLDELGKQLNSLELHYSSLKESKVSILTKSQEEVIFQFHNELGKDKGEQLAELQSISCGSTNFNSVQYLQEIAVEQQFEVTYMDVNEKSFCGDLQCLLQISSLPLAFYGHGTTYMEAQFSAAQCALEYLKNFTKA